MTYLYNVFDGMLNLTHPNGTVLGGKISRPRWPLK